MEGEVGWEQGAGGHAEPEITERKECSSPGGGMGGGGGAGLVLAEVTCGCGCDEGPRTRVKASSGTEGSSRGSCCAGRADGNNSTDGNVQSSNNGNKSWVTTEATMEREFTVDWIEGTPQRRRLPPRETRQWSIRLPNGRSLLQYG